jgi:hypothetical protein
MQANANLINLLFVSGGPPELFGGAAKTPESVAVKTGFKEILDCLPVGFGLPEAESQITESPVITPAEQAFAGGLFPADEIADAVPLLIPLEDDAQPFAKIFAGGAGRLVDETLPMAMGKPALIAENGEESAVANSPGFSKLPGMKMPGIVFETQNKNNGNVLDEKLAGQDSGEKQHINEIRKIGFDGKDAPFANRAIIPEGLIDSLKATTDVATNGEKGGISPSPALTTLADLENLEVDRSLVLTYPADSEESAGTVRITKESQGQSFNSKTFTGFTVEFRSGEEVTNLKAVVVKNSGTAGIENNLAGLEGLVEKNEGRDARLILFVPAKSPAAEQVMAKAAHPAVGADLNLRSDFISMNGAANPGPATVREVQVPDYISPTGEISAESSAQNPRPIAAAGQDPGANQEHTFSARDESGQETFKPVAKSPEMSFFETAVEKLDNTQLTLPGEQESGQPKSVGEIRTTNNMPELNQFKQVQFKVELPQDGIKIPQGGYFRIKLEPEMLGKIDVQLRVINDQFIARMEVDNPIAKQVVEANLPQLRETLQSHGIKVENIMVNLAGEGFEHDLSGQEAAENWRDRMWFNSKSGIADDGEQIKTGDITASGSNTNLKGSLSLLA